MYECVLQKYPLANYYSDTLCKPFSFVCVMIVLFKRLVDASIFLKIVFVHLILNQQFI